MLLVSNQVALQTLPVRYHSVHLVGNLLDVFLGGSSEERPTEVPDKAERSVTYLPATLAFSV